jgi:two-component sensor histidine kinase
MALVHEQLYRSENLKEIDLSLYIQALLEKISDSHSNSTKEINFNVQTEAIHLNIETTHACGLIINELVTNALEHAFTNRQQGNIWLNLGHDHHRDIILTIKDDGIGLAADFDFERSESLGLRLVRILTKQLEGKLEIQRTEGTCFKLTFSELNYCDRF